MHISEAIKQFGRYQHMRGRAAGTQRSYGYLLAQYGRWLAAHKLSWQKITGRQIESFLEEYRESHSRTSTALFATCLGSFYRWARRRQLVTANPMDEIEDIERDRPAPRALPDHRVRQLLAALDKLSARDRLIVRTFLYTGLRLAELAGLGRSDLDMDARTITVRHAKGGRERIIAMAAVLHADLLTWPDLPESGPLWRCARGRLSAAGISEMFRREIQGRLGYEEVTAHVLRHTHATKLRRTGADLRGIQTHLGHARPETTAIYTAVYDDELHRAVDRLTADW